MLTRLTSTFILIAFILTNTVPIQTVFAQNTGSVLTLPPVGTLLSISPGFTPTIVKGLTLHPENPLQFDFIVDTGDAGLKGEAFKSESTKLIKYFLTALTVPEDEQWVNLSPYEKDRIVPDALGITEMGRDLLAQDYLLKQITASLVYPEDELGERFWNRVYQKAQAKFGTSEVPVDTFNKVWIVPDRAVVYEYEGTVFVVENYLKVMLEEDYLAMENNSSGSVHDLSKQDFDQSHESRSLSSNVIKDIILPELEKEVNQGKNFANLRQVYNSMLLATWYKRNLKESLLGQVYAEQNKVDGIDIEDKQIKERIYQQYLKAFKEGVYNYIREDYDNATDQPILRKYFSGGMNGYGTIEITTASLLDDNIQSIASSAVGDNARVTWEAVEVADVDRELSIESFPAKSLSKKRRTSKEIEQLIVSGFTYYRSEFAKVNVEMVTIKAFAEMLGLPESTVKSYRKNSIIADGLEEIIGPEKALLRSISFFIKEIKQGKIPRNFTNKTLAEKAGVTRRTLIKFKKIEPIKSAYKELQELIDSFFLDEQADTKIIQALNSYFKEIDEGRIDLILDKDIAERSGLTLKYFSKRKINNPRLGKLVDLISGHANALLRSIAYYELEILEGRVSGRITQYMIAEKAGVSPVYISYDKHNSELYMKKALPILWTIENLIGKMKKSQKDILKAMAFYKQKALAGKITEDIQASLIYEKANVGSATFNREIKNEILKASYELLQQLAEPMLNELHIDNQILKVVEFYEKEIRKGKIGLITQVEMAERMNIEPTYLSQRKDSNPDLRDRIDAIVGAANAILRAVAFYDRETDKGAIDNLSDKMIAKKAGVDVGTVVAHKDKVKKAIHSLKNKIKKRNDRKMDDLILQTVQYFKDQFSVGEVGKVTIKMILQKSGLRWDQLTVRRIHNDYVNKSIKSIIGEQAAIWRTIDYYIKENAKGKKEKVTESLVASKAGVSVAWLWGYKKKKESIVMALKKVVIYGVQLFIESRGEEIVNYFDETNGSKSWTHYAEKFGISTHSMVKVFKRLGLKKAAVEELIVLKGKEKEIIEYFNQSAKNLTWQEYADYFGVSVRAIERAFRILGLKKEKGVAIKSVIQKEELLPLINDRNMTLEKISKKLNRDESTVRRAIFEVYKLSYVKKLAGSRQVVGYKLIHQLSKESVSYSDTDLEELLLDIVLNEDQEAVQTFIYAHMKDISKIVKDRVGEISNSFKEQEFDRLFSEAIIFAQGEMLPEFLSNQDNISGNFKDFLQEYLPEYLRSVKNLDWGHFREFSGDQPVFDDNSSDSYQDRFLSDSNSNQNPLDLVSFGDIGDLDLTEGLDATTHFIIEESMGDDFSIEDIAVQLDISEADVQSRLEDGLQILQDLNEEQLSLASSAVSEPSFDDIQVTESPFGGIDLNSANLDLQIKRDGKGIPLPTLQQPLDSIDIKGFVPVIINISPVNVPQLLGFSEPERPYESADNDEELEMFLSRPVIMNRMDTYCRNEMV